MSRSVRILERARADVDSIFDWLVRRSVRGAVSWYLAFGRAIEKIVETPDSFPEAPEAHPLGRDLWQTLFKTRRGRNYRIVFQVLDAEILILRVRGPGQAPLKPQEVPPD